MNNLAVVVRSNSFRKLQESLKNFWVGLKQQEFRTVKHRPDAERYVKRRIKRLRSVKRRYSYKIAKAND